MNVSIKNIAREKKIHKEHQSLLKVKYNVRMKRTIQITKNVMN